MAHTEIIGNGMITVVLDGGLGDYITPDKFLVERIYWLSTAATDKIILREYIPGITKDKMPYVPLLSISIATIGVYCPDISIRYMIDYAASTTPADNILTFAGKWGV